MCDKSFLFIWLYVSLVYIFYIYIFPSLLYKATFKSYYYFHM